MAKVAPIMDVDPTLAHVYDASKFQPGWWASEKLDGVRALWIDGQLVTRTGRLIHAPQGFLEGLPEDMNLDGELFMRRGAFDETSGTVRKHYPTDDVDMQAYLTRWAPINFHVFDTYGGRTPYGDRLASLYVMADDPTNYSVQVVEQTPIGTTEELEAYVERLVAAGAEGAMLRYPEMHYDFGRTRNLLKCKRFYDMDALVIGYEPGKGKHVGRVGALTCATIGSGFLKHVFKVGTGLTDAQREDPPKVGSTIIVKYHEITKAGVPRFPVYVGQRAD